MKVLIIPEDPTFDQYIVKPVVERLLKDLGLTGRVDVLRDPKLEGIDKALDKDVIADIVNDNPMEDLFVLVVDRDCDRMNNSTRTAARVAEHRDRLVACLAKEELEVWMLALYRDELGVRWSEVTQECDPKEKYAEPFMARKGWTAQVGRGRKRAMHALGGAWTGLLSVCPEIATLKSDVQNWKMVKELL